MTTEFKMHEDDDGHSIPCRTCSCAVPTTLWDGQHGFKDRDQPLSLDPIYLCEVCYMTLLGSALRYPGTTPGQYDMALGMIECTNMILTQLRHPMHVIHTGEGHATKTLREICVILDNCMDTLEASDDDVDKTLEQAMTVLRDIHKGVAWALKAEEKTDDQG